MPVPAIPPEIIEEILQKLPAGEDATIDTLFACMLVSSTFKATARLDSVWVPIVRCNSNLGHIPRYVALSNEQDKHALELILKRKELSSTYECILARSTFEEIVNRHLDALLAESSHKIPHILAIVELGECNTFPVLDKLAFLQSDETQAEEWLARRYWARQARGAISRRKAFDVWRRIGAGWDGVQAFCEGVFAFDAFHGSQNLDDIKTFLPRLVYAVEDAVTDWKQECVTADAIATPLRRLGAAIIRHVLFFGCWLEPNVIGRADPLENPIPDQCFPNSLIADIGKRLAEVDALSDNEDPDDVEYVEGHATVLAALLCAAVRQHGRSGLLVRPTQLPSGTAVAYAFERRDGVMPAPEEWEYIGLGPSFIFTHDDLRIMYDSFDSENPFRPIGFDAFCGPTSAADLIDNLASDTSVAFGMTGRPHADLTIEDFATGQYGCGMVHFSFLSASARHRRLGAEDCFPADTAPVRDAITHSPMPTAWIEKQLKGVGKAEKQDANAPEVHLRSALASPPRFRVGDVVKGYSGAGEPSFNLITEWGVHSTGGGAEIIMYKFLDRDGMHHGSTDVGLQPHHLSADEISHMTSMYDVGKYFKAVDMSGARPRFIMADDHFKLYPEDG